MLIAEPNFEAVLGAMVGSADEGVFCVFLIEGTDDFIQVAYNLESDRPFNVDFPLITEEQRAKEEVFRAAADELGLEIELVESGGLMPDRFLDAYLAEPGETADALRKLFRAVFATNESTRFRIDYDGFEWAPN